MLLNRIELQLPKDDHVKYDSRARKLDWDQIKFKDYSAEDCKKYWEHIQARIRRFRILQEMIPDARAWLNQPWTNFYKSKVGFLSNKQNQSNGAHKQVEDRDDLLETKFRSNEVLGSSSAASLVSSDIWRSCCSCLSSDYSPQTIPTLNCKLTTLGNFTPPFCSPVWAASKLVF